MVMVVNTTSRYDLVGKGGTNITHDKRMHPLCPCVCREDWLTCVNCSESRNVSAVLSFHTITSKIRQTCVPALTYSSVVHFSVQHGKIGRGRGTKPVQVRLRLIWLKTMIAHGNSTSDQ